MFIGLVATITSFTCLSPIALGNESIAVTAAGKPGASSSRGEKSSKTTGNKAAPLADDTAVDDTAVDDTAVDDTAVDDTAMDDTANPNEIVTQPPSEVVTNPDDIIIPRRQVSPSERKKICRKYEGALIAYYDLQSITFKECIRRPLVASKVDLRFSAAR